jgi:formylglycine-generating enzyme required for sulfatase activity
MHRAKRCGVSSEDNQPVVLVSCKDAEAYARKVGKRLLTDMEWEKAARGIDGRIFPWGNVFSERKCNSGRSGIEKTTPVTKYPQGKSPYRCYDMVGNVWEWTSSWYDEKELEMVCRGGSYSDRVPVHQVESAITDASQFCRTAYRKGEKRNGYAYNIGFRLAKDLNG